MAKISLWKPSQGQDYRYTDGIVKDYIDMGATGVYVHKYIGPVEQTGDANTSTAADGVATNELDIGDVLFLENRNRKYDPNIYELRGAYTISDTDFDLTQFGIFLAEDTIFMNFHLTENVARLGRKLMAGDVLELPHLREFYPLDTEKDAINRFYVVEDASHSAEGYGPNWWSHIWRVRAKMMPASTEYTDILNRAAQGSSWPESGDLVDPDDCCVDTVGDTVGDGGIKDTIQDAIIAEAAGNVGYDPLRYRAAHLWILIDPETQAPSLIQWKTGDGRPPNGIALYGSGDTFPDTMSDGDYYLRTDFDRPVLYQKREGCKFYKIEVDQRKLPWTGANQLLDSFVDNDTITTNEDGTTMPEKQALSKVVLARTRDSAVTYTPAETPTDRVPHAVIIATPSTGVGGGTPLTVVYDGSTSYRDRGSIVSYVWDFGDGTAGATGVTVAHTYTNFGNYAATLTVTDNIGYTDTATYTMYVDATTIFTEDFGPEFG
jgi:hypothetical protein